MEPLAEVNCYINRQAANVDVPRAANVDVPRAGGEDTAEDALLVPARSALDKLFAVFDIWESARVRPALRAWRPWHGLGGRVQ